MYQFQGRWHTQALLQGLLECQKHFEANDFDIILVTNPKSLVSSTSGNHPLLVTNPHLLVPFLEGVYYESPDFDFSKLPSPRLMNTHIPHLSLPESVKSSSCKIVYCCRNPKDMFVSLWHFGKKLAPQETADYPIEKAGCGFIGEEEVRGIVKLCSFESLSNLEVNREGKLPNGMETKAFFRKGDVGGWGDTLSESLAEKIDRTIEERFQGSGLTFSC
ncbi:unnamed protein product [Brassica napus]|uniref:Sulfotransferase n=1 Tax=Brassica napus TaxID=3708 RepID=A0A816KK89_BRANA|nr:unnamed protein product [Brassica napus]